MISNDNVNNGLNVLSLFDGISCGMIALERAGIPVKRYVAYEIDKYAIKTSVKNYPQIEHCGNVFDGDFTQYEGFDLLIGGSPCTYWSIAKTKNRETVASGMGWELFCQYVRALKESKPKYFLYENNKSMSKEIKKSISESFGFEPVLINSALLSAQNRQRLYWCGIRQNDGTYKKAEIVQPEDKGLLLKDILETGIAWQDKSYTYTTRCHAAIPENKLEKHQHTMVAEKIVVDKKQTYKDKKIDELVDKYGYLSEIVDKSPTITAACGISNTSSEVNIVDNLVHVKPMNYKLDRITNNETGVVGMLDMKGYDCIKRVYNDNGKAPTLTTCAGGHREPKVFTNIDTVIVDGKSFPVYEVKNNIITIKGKNIPLNYKMDIILFASSQ